MADHPIVNRGGDVQAQVAAERRRELAVEHLLFATMRHLARHDPGLLSALEQSLEHLGDSARDETKDDEAVREVARRFINSLRAET